MTGPTAAAGRPTSAVTARTRAPRVLAVLAGAGCLGYGVTALLRGGRSTDLGSVLPWLAGVLVVHDAVLAPLGVAAGGVLARLLVRRRDVRAVVAAGAFVATCVILLAVPALVTPGVPGNPTTTPRDYPRGLLVLLGLDAVVTATVALVVVLAGRRSGGVRSRRGTR